MAVNRDRDAAARGDDPADADVVGIRMRPAAHVQARQRQVLAGGLLAGEVGAALGKSALEVAITITEQIRAAAR